MAEEGTKDDFLFLRREFDDFFSLLLNQWLKNKKTKFWTKFNFSENLKIRGTQYL